MKNLIKNLPLLCILLTMQHGCNRPDKQTTGTILGGTAGAAVGSMFGKGTGRTVSTGIGAVLGAVGGRELLK